MRIFILIASLFSFSAYAELSVQEAHEIIDQMVVSNTISSEEAVKAKMRASKRLAGNKSLLRMPASVMVADIETVDLGTEQYETIENDLQVIAPDIATNGKKITKKFYPDTRISKK